MMIPEEPQDPDTVGTGEESGGETLLLLLGIGEAEPSRFRLSPGQVLYLAAQFVGWLHSRRYPSVNDE